MSEAVIEETPADPVEGGPEAVPANEAAEEVPVEEVKELEVPAA